MSIGGVNRTFAFDAQDRLTSAVGPWGMHGYQYDVVGNRTQYTECRAVSDYLYEPHSNRIDLSTPWDYTLDARGNTTQKMRPDGSGFRFVFDSQNRLFQARDLQSNALLASYRYNALGQRVAKTVGGITTRLVYGLDGKLLAEMDVTGTVLREYVWLNGLPLAVLGSPNGATPAPVVFDQIVDNNDASTLPTCYGWQNKRDRDAEGGSYLISGGSVTCGQEYGWSASLPVTGAYDVSIKWLGTETTEKRRTPSEARLFESAMPAKSKAAGSSSKPSTEARVV